jgi:ribose transport system permease protein
MKEVVLKHRKKYSLKEIRMKVGENNFQIMSILSGLLIMMLVFSFNSKYFFTSNNLLTIALQTSMIAIIALGQTFVLITAGIDLSIGSNMAIAGVISAMALKSGMPIGIAIILGLLAGVLVGLINGSLIALLKVLLFLLLVEYQ